MLSFKKGKEKADLFSLKHEHQYVHVKEYLRQRRKLYIISTEVQSSKVLNPLCAFSFAYLLDAKGYIIHKAISSPFLPSDSEQLRVE